MRGPLGLRKPRDTRHLDRFPLSAAPPTAPIPAVVAGVNWYTNFDKPEKVGNVYMIGRGNLGMIRGAHCVALKNPATTDPITWWEFYDQLAEGACVGFGCSRMSSENNRRRYDAPWLYHRAQDVDEFEDTPPEEGTTVRSGLWILQAEGARRVGEKEPRLADGINAYRWATSWDEVRAALGIPAATHSVPLLNSWGRGYPHIVHLTDEAGSRLLYEDGEIGVPTDR